MPLSVEKAGWHMSVNSFAVHHFKLGLIAAFTFLSLSDLGQAEVASIYGGPDGLCGHRTASGEHFDCAAMTAAHRTLPFGTKVTVCHKGCVLVRINDRGRLRAAGILICRPLLRGLLDCRIPATSL